MSDQAASHLQTPTDRIDPGVALPANVMAARAASDAAHAAVYGTPQPPSAASSNGTNGTGNGTGNGHEPQQQELSLQPPELPDTNPDGTANWENRFKSLRGRWDAEQRRTRETLEEYEQRMRQMQTEFQRATRPPLPGTGELPPMVSDEEIQDYGPDLIDVMKRVAIEATMPMLKPIATTVGQMQARVETTESEASKQFLARMHSSMDQSVPGWEDLNKDPNFVAWTKRNDVFSGLNRQELLQKAWYAGDSNRVAAFFRGYLAEEAAVDPAAAQVRQQAYGNGNAGHTPYQSTGGSHAPSTPPPAPRVTLESLAAPGRARAAASAPAGKPVWTAAGISQFYMDVARGVFAGRDAERAATEADLMSAQREGRIQVDPRTATHLGR